MASPTLYYFFAFSDFLQIFLSSSYYTLAVVHLSY
jgi:hypothetical protein